MTNITLLTAASAEYWPVMQLSAPNKLEYCLRHHIQLKVGVHLAPDMFGNWEPGDLVLHLPGLPNKRRVKIMSEKLLEVVR